MDAVKPPLASLLKCHGGKHYQKRWIIPELPAARVFVESHCYGLNVLLNLPRFEHEVANDLNPEVIHFWTVVRDDVQALQRRLARVRYAEETFVRAADPSWGHANCPIDRAARFYIRNRMSRGGLGQSFAWSERTRGGLPGDLNAWRNSLTRFPWVSQRLQGVHLTCEDAADLLLDLNIEDCLVYADPPYLQETRKSKKAYGLFEMTAVQHAALLGVLTAHKGPVAVSGYASDLYSSVLAGWRVVQRVVVNNSGQNRTKGKRTEVLWVNRTKACDSKEGSPCPPPVTVGPPTTS
jgi:DNA adenine methylase